MDNTGKMGKPMRHRNLLPLLALAGLALVAATGCGGAATASAGSSAKSTKLTLVAYSTPREAYEQRIPAFEKAAGGKGVTFDPSYGSSREQSRAVADPLPADVVGFSLEPAIT